MASGAVAAAATTALAAAADAAGVPLEIDGETIPLLGFAQMTFLGAVLGGLLVAALNRWSSHARRRFVQVAVALTALSCVPSVALPPDAATKADARRHPPARRSHHRPRRSPAVPSADARPPPDTEGEPRPCPST